MIRVLHVLGGLGSGGAESFIMNMYRAIDREKIQFDFLIRGAEIPGLVEEIEQLGGRIYRTASFPRHFLKNYVQTRQFFRAHREYQVIHVHANSLLYMLPLRLACKFQIPCRIVHSHSVQTSVPAAKGVHLHNKKRIDKIVTKQLACSKAAGQWMFSSEKYEVIPNGIDFGRFSYNSAKRESLRAELFLDHRVVIGHVGRFVNEKNHEFVIKVFEEYLKQDPNAVLLLIGDGEKREHIHQFVCKKGLEDRVIFTGEVTNVEEYYSAMDVFLFPSLYEGLGIVLIEAQSQGLPCVISERIPSEVVINDNCTALSLNADISVWTDALAKANRIEAISPKMQEYDSCVSAAKLAQIYLQEEKI